MTMSSPWRTSSTCVTFKRNSLGRRIAWLFPDLKTFAIATETLPESVQLSIHATYIHLGFSSSDPPGPHTPCLQGFHLGDGRGGLVFQRFALLVVFGLGILAGRVFEVEVAEVLVDCFFALAQVVDAGLVGLHEGVALRPEDVDKQRNGQDKYGQQAHRYSVSRRMRSRRAASWGLDGAAGGNSAPGAGVAPAIDNALRFQSHTTTNVPAVASRKTAMGTIHATLSKPPRIGAARIVGPYFAANHCSTSASLLLVASCACSSRIITGESGQLTWLHSSRIWLQPQEHINSWPRRSKRDWPAPSIATVMTHSRAVCTVRAQNTGPRQDSISLRMGHLRQHARHAQRGSADWDQILQALPNRSPNQIWRQCDECACHHNRHADPDPCDQRIEESLDDGKPAVRIGSFEH